MVSERELQDVLMGRGYYDDILSRDLEARKDPDKAVPKQAAASAQGQRRMTMGQWRQRQAGREEEKGKRLRECLARVQDSARGLTMKQQTRLTRIRTAAPGRGREEANTVPGSMTSTAGCSGARPRMPPWLSVRSKTH